MLRDKDTSREDFIFFTDRLSMFLAEQALALLPFKPKSVITPTEAEYHGKESAASVSAMLRHTQRFLVELGVYAKLRISVESQFFVRKLQTSCPEYSCPYLTRHS